MTLCPHFARLRSSPTCVRHSVVFVCVFFGPNVYDITGLMVQSMDLVGIVTGSVELSSFLTIWTLTMFVWLKSRVTPDQNSHSNNSITESFIFSYMLHPHKSSSILTNGTSPKVSTSFLECSDGSLHQFDVYCGYATEPPRRQHTFGSQRFFLYTCRSGKHRAGGGESDLQVSFDGVAVWTHSLLPFYT